MMRYRAILTRVDGEFVEKGSQCHGNDLERVREWAMEQAAQMAKGWEVRVVEVREELAQVVGREEGERWMEERRERERRKREEKG